MSATTPNVGVRIFSDLSNTNSITSVQDGGLGICLPVPGASNDMEFDEPFEVDLYDATAIDVFPEGTLARDTLNQFIAAGAIAKIGFVRAREDADPENQAGLIAGEAGSSTGMFAFKHIFSHLKFEPSFLISPSYGAQRFGGAANPVAAAMSTVAEYLVDCMGVFDTPLGDKNAAIEAAADFKGEYNMIATFPQVTVNLGGTNVNRPLSTHVAAEHLIRDAQVGNPFKAAWNRQMNGVLDTDQVVSYKDGRTDHDANALNQGGVVTVIEGSTLWGPYTTATDATTLGYRSIKRIRTRRALEKALLKSSRKYNADDLGPHLAAVIYRDASQFLEDVVAQKALIDYELVWDKSLNNAAVLEAGGLRTKMRFAETPDLTDLQIYTEPQPEAFDLLGGRIGAAIARLGNSNIRIAS